MTKQDRVEILRKMHIVDEYQLAVLDNMGFFTTPASTKFHGAYEGGLFDHSLEVTNQLLNMKPFKWQRDESPMIVGMFHDLCKCDEYEVVSHPCDPNVKFGHVKNTVLKGHGEKSVMLLSTLMQLTEEEMLCIRYHMGAYNTDDWNGYDLAIKKYPNVLFTHTADMLASKVVGV